VQARVYQVGALGRGYALTGTAGPLGSTAMTRTLTLGGTFTTGITVNVRAGGLLLAAHTVVAGNTNLAGVATAIAGKINASGTGYTASAVGSDVTVTGPLGVSYTLASDVSGASSMEVNRYYQRAAGVSAGSAYSVRISLATYFAWRQDGLLDPGAVIGFTIRLNGVDLPWVRYTISYAQSKQQALSGLVLAFQGSSLEAAGFRLVGEITSFGYQLRLTRTTVGQVIALFVDQSAGLYYLAGGIDTLADTGTDPVASARPQISDVTVFGTPVAGEVYRIELGPVAAGSGAITSTPTNYDYTAVGGDTAVSVAAALAPLVDAASDYAAAVSDRALGGAVDTVRITGALTPPTSGAEWSVRAFVLRAITVTTT